MQYAMMPVTVLSLAEVSMAIARSRDKFCSIECCDCCTDRHQLLADCASIVKMLEFSFKARNSKDKLLASAQMVQREVGRRPIPTLRSCLVPWLPAAACVLGLITSEDFHVAVASTAACTQIA